jgi:hypothetical protein
MMVMLILLLSLETILSSNCFLDEKYHSVYWREFNSGFEKGTILTQKQIFQYIKRLNNFLNYGWALWRWSYVPDLNIPAFNLAKIEITEYTERNLF